MTPDQIIEVVTAFKNGKNIQVRKKDNKSEQWRSIKEPGFPAWDFCNYDYRVVPEPRVIYVNEYLGNWGTVRNTKNEASSQAERNCVRKAVKFVEVIED